MRNNVKNTSVVASLAVLGAALQAGTAHAAIPCENLAQLKFPNGKVTGATAVAAGAFKPPPANPASGPQTPADTWANLPAFCRVETTINAAPDSEIRVETWLPEKWNGKFVGVGNGVWAGVLSYVAMAEPLRLGYAVASTDTGHQSANPLDASFAVGHPEKLTDFAHRAIHEMTRASKVTTSTFYQSRPKRALFTSCSTGGRQGLMEAYRYPQDYDAISSMAPANPMVPLMVGSLWTGYVTMKDDASRIPPKKFGIVHQAALATCDANDGVKDDIIGSPQRCGFDPAALRCKGADGEDCLTGPQVRAFQAIYSGAKNPRTNERIYPGFSIGSEPMLPVLAGGREPFPVATTYLRGLVFKDPQWDFRNFDYDKDVSLALEAGKELDVPATGLKKFFDEDRKLLLSHGWADGLIPAQSTIDFYNALTASIGKRKAEKNVRLFMAPGMAHCAGGSGPSVIDTISVLEQWLDSGKPPERIVASNPLNAKPRTRPLCPYPQEAVYTGGDADSEKNFKCEAPEQQP